MIAMATTTPTTAASLEELILAAGMTSYAADCDVVVIRRTPRVAEPVQPVSEVTPPFAGD